MTLKVHFSSAKENWATPPDLFADLHREFGFALDVCAESWNAKLPRYFTEADDALKQEWKGVCWMNPPYGRKIGHFMRKAYQSAQAGATVVCLVPARTDVRWWQFTHYAAEIRWIIRRVRFLKDNGKGASAPFPSAIVVFKPHEGGVVNKRMIRLGGVNPAGREVYCWKTVVQ
jgi:phage N-6-adenine-methyltransferase